MLSLKSLAQKKALPALTVLVQSVFVLPILECYYLANAELEKQVITEKIVANATTLSKLFYDSGLAIGAFSLTKNQAFIERYNKLVNQIPPTSETIRQLVNRQPVKEIRFSEIDQITAEAVKQLQDAKTILKDSSISPLGDDKGEVRALYKRVKSLADQLQEKLDGLCQAETDLSKNSPTARRMYELVLLLIFFSYVGLNIAIHIKYLKLIAKDKVE